VISIIAIELLAPFRDRADAGRFLAERLSRYRDQADVIVLGLPRGGVPVAFEIAQFLRASLDVFLVRKLGVPGHEELAMGAIASGGVRVLHEDEAEGGGDRIEIEPQQEQGGIGTMTCREVMTENPACASRNDTVIEAARLMKREGVGPIPIVDDTNGRRLVGIVTDRDLAVKVLAEGKDPMRTTVEQVMTTKLVTCRPEDDLGHAIDAMMDHKIRRIPIVDENDRLVGIVSQADVARNEDEKKTGRTVEKISEPDGPGSR
jgi:CBS domain-containing protein